MSDESIPNVSERAVIRAVRSEVRSDEQTRILDLLRQAAFQAESAAASSRRPTLSGMGRRAVGLRLAIELMETAPPNYVGEEWSTVGTWDTVSIHFYDPPDDPDELPVRLLACDNAESTSAAVYLSIDEAEQHFADGLRLVDKLRAERAQRAEPAPESDQAESA